MNATEQPSDADLLEGVAAIGAYMKWKARRVHHLIETEGLPAFKLSGRICARRYTLNTWLAEREAEARKAHPDG